MQPERKYRSILPGPPSATPRSLADDAEGGASSTATVPGGQEGSKRKRRATTKACNSCREKKIGCNGLQPCSHCQRRGLACEYATISKTILNSIPSGMRLLDETTANAHRYAAELLSILRALPDDQVRDVLQQLRAGTEASNIVTSLRGKGQLHSAYDIQFHGILHGVPPPDQTSLEFELMVRHAIAYSPWAPTELPHLDLELPSRASQSLSIESTPTAVSPMSMDTPSPLPPAESEPFPSLSRTRFSVQEPREARSSSLNLGLSGKSSARETGSMEAPSLCDERLQKVDILAWSDVRIPGETAKRVLSLYLETDHATTALFDADLFLEGLTTGSTRFCSRLLVSSLFSWACQAYSAFDLEAVAWSHEFYDEAVQTFQHESSLGLGAPVTVAALLYLSMSSTCHAQSATDATEHLETAIELAKSMGLFGVADEGLPERWPDGNADMLWEKASAQTAWGSFVYITTQCAHNQTCRILYPPRFLIPGDDEETDDADYPEEQTLSSFVGKGFPFLCRLALIAHDMIWLNYAGGSLEPAAHAKVESMEAVYRRYLEWADSLPLELVRSGDSSHHVLLLHIYLHAFILDLFRPLIQHGDAVRVRLDSFTSQQASPEAVCSASAVQLRQIAVTYFQRCASASYSFNWHTALLYVANAALREPAQATDNSERRADVRTCILVYHRLQRCFRLSQGVVRGLVSMALREGLIASSDARAIIKDSDEKGKHHQLSDPILAPFIVDLDLALVDPVAARVDNMAAEFDELAILNEFTVVNVARQPPEFMGESAASDAEL
ncbi:Activator of stress genes 3 [Colletotrichum chlorophyti]|uniref:Activator of stress genes 3 n=1 Tax=Colletotrichum chlorophyti TaxID=708187 RepID=A0A1Q8RXS9_9PEZI|nr:Activator of stress genes 3 [Colletotrichum chlorophyti]